MANLTKTQVTMIAVTMEATRATMVQRRDPTYSENPTANGSAQGRRKAGSEKYCVRSVFNHYFWAETQGNYLCFSWLVALVYSVIMCLSTLG